MANHEKQLKQERDDIPFTHIVIPTSITLFMECMLSCVGMCVCFVHRWFGDVAVSGRWQLALGDALLHVCFMVYCLLLNCGHIITV